MGKNTLLPLTLAVGAMVAIGVGYWESRPDPIDTDLPASAPAVGSCWPVTEDTAARSAFPWPEPAVDCAAPHTAEVYHVAQVPVDLIRQARDSEGEDRTVAISLMYASARRDCSVRASDFLAGDWHSGRVTVLATWVDPPASGFFACSLAQTGDPAGATYVRRAGTLRGALGAAGAELAIGCVVRSGGGTAFGRCDQPHDGEFVGAYTLLPENASFVEAGVREEANRGCGRLAATYLGLPADRGRSDLRVAYVGPLTAPEWLGSDQTFSCYAMSDVRLKASVRGLRTGRLPA